MIDLLKRYWAWRTRRKEERKRREEEKKLRKGPVRYWIDVVGSIVITVFLIKAMVVEAYRIPSPSMEKTLLVGDFLLVNKFVYGMKTPDWIGIPLTMVGFDIPYVQLPSLAEPKTGDVIVFKYPLDPRQNYIKRCIAGPGQTIEIRDKRVFVDGVEFEHLPHQQQSEGLLEAGMPERGIVPGGMGWNRHNFGPLEVPADSYFMMGDNRDNSSDSRFWGFVPRENIVGKAWIIYFSWDGSQLKRRFWKVIRVGRLLDLIR
jgi:signal peptidase I